MNSNIINSRLIILSSIILIGAFMRLIPHWPNFTPIAAMALFGGAYIGKRVLTFLIPLLAMFLSDLIIGFHQDMFAVYIAFVLTVMIGLAIRNKISFGSVILGSLSASVLFFLITNFSAWLTMPLYSKTFAGLMQAYVAGLAFFNNGSYGISFFLNTVIGGLFFVGIFCGAFYLVRSRFPAIAESK